MASFHASHSDTCSLEMSLKCSICLDAFQDPVTTDCGHTFCKKCLDFSFQYNDQVCPLCKKPLSKVPEVNIVLRDIVQELNKTLETDADMYTGKDGEVPCDVCTGNRRKAKKSCLVCLASYCSIHLENHLSSERLKGHKLVAPVKNLDDRACLDHGRPLELYNRKRRKCVCVRCLEEDPEEVVTTEEEWNRKKTELENTKTRMQRKIQKRTLKINNVNMSLKSCKEQLDNEWWDIEAVFAAIHAAVEEAQATVLKPLEERRQRLETEATGLQQTLTSDIKKLEKTIWDLDKLSQLEDHIFFLQSYPPLPDLAIRKMADVQFDTSLMFGSMRNTTAIMMDEIEQELEKLTSVESRRVQIFAADVL